MADTTNVSVYTSGSNAIKLAGSRNFESTHAHEGMILAFEEDARKTNSLNRKSYLMIISAFALMIVSIAIYGFGNEYYRHAIFDSVPTEEIVVKSGDTLWSLSQERPVNGLSISEEIYEIKQLNKLDTSEIFVGMKLIVPVEFN